MSSVDTLSKAERSKRMSLVKSKDTKPELAVRKLLFSLGFRYRLQAKGLPGKPDIVFRKKKKAIFVHGCFWHQHNCGAYKMPKSRIDFWHDKLSKNHIRDKKNLRILRKDGWKVLVVWECQIKKRSLQEVEKRLIKFLEE